MSFGKTNYRIGGTRGGADQFKWEDVKNDKYRENYLGHSVQAPVGRWQKGKDLTWYAKANKLQRAEALQAELALAKQRDEDLMNEALGIAPKKRHEPREGLSTSEMKELLKRGEAERDGMDVERVEGLGAAPVEAEGFEMGPKRTLAERYKDQLASGKADVTYALPGTINDEMAEVSKSARKEARKAEKEAKKLKKKEKKERKKEKKAKRHHTRDSDEEDAEKPRRSRHNNEENEARRSRSRSPRRNRATGRRSRSTSRRRNGRSRSPTNRRRYETSPRRSEDSRGRSRLPESPRRRHRHHRHRSASVSPAPRKRSRSRSYSRSRRRY
ncbi:T-complex protein 1 subunit zeta [Phytophthora palmivora]|uniref:T-complex protein 1 subunit zeta n=1 Tax=Phytophthora palmivora TaxID=4796 RepID=A0A2P4XTN7_9STRA|nr:T-complex protein 1 subunit zeta [Phytophthora palmivora]